MNTETKEHVFEVGSPAELLVKNIRGLVSVKPGEAGVIKITETRYLDDGNPDYTEIAVGKNASGTVYAKVGMPEHFFGFIHRRPLRIDFEIEAPVETNLSVKVVSGAVEAVGLTGSMNLKTVSGSVTAKDLNGDLYLDSVSGAIRGTNLSGEAKISVVSGKLDLRGCDFPSLRAKVVSGKAVIETVIGDGPYRLETVSGKLVLVVPEGTGCTVDAKAVSGSFKTDLSVSQSTISRRSWHVQIGDGSTPVQMKAVSGSMRLLSSFDAVGSTPGNVNISRKQREQILTRLSDGEIDVEQAVRELGG